MNAITASGESIRRNASTSASPESDYHQVVMNTESTKLGENSMPPRLSPNRWIYKVPDQPPVSPNRCIYEVPDRLRKLNKMSYTPRVISIGPIHHGNKKLQPNMEKSKDKYLNDFVVRVKKSTEELVNFVKDREQRIRECYAEKYMEDNSDEFVKMILRDAAFIIEYLLENRQRSWLSWPDDDEDDTIPKHGDDDIVAKRWLISKIEVDLLLLENELPFFIIKELFDLILVSDTKVDRPFLHFVLDFFQQFETEDYSDFGDTENIFHDIKHFVDLLRMFNLPVSSRDDKSREGPNFLESILESRRKHGNIDHYVEEMYHASQLAEAGLIFKKSKSRCPLELKFQDGVLEIPGITFDKYTQLYARNLMAFEDFHYKHDAYITDYYRLLDFLIDIDKDVSLLRRKKILVNKLGAIYCATMVNNLCSDDVTYPPTIYYELCRDLVRFYDNPWNWKSWKIKLRRDLSTPWIIVTTIGAILLLLLTLVQTVCTVIQTVK